MEGVVHACDGDGHMDSWGIGWIKEGPFNQIADYPLIDWDSEDLSEYTFPTESVDELVSNMAAISKGSAKRLLGCDVSPCLFELACRLRGMEGALLDLAVGGTAVECFYRRAASFGGADFFVPKNQGYIKKLGKNPNGRPAFMGWGALNPFTAKKDIVDNQVAVLEFANRVRATFHTNCATGIPERRMYLCGTEGTLRADVIAGTIETCRFEYDQKPVRHDSGVSGGHGGGDPILARELHDAMTCGAPPPSTLEHGLRAAVTCFGIDRALDTGRVVDLRPMWKKAVVKVK